MIPAGARRTLTTISKTLGQLLADGGADAAVQSVMETADRHRDAGQFADAAMAYRDAVAIDPTNVAAWVQLGNMLKDIGSLETATEAYSSALKIAHEDADTLLQLGRTQRLLGNTTEAIDLFRRALAIEPSQCDAATELLALGAELPESTVEFGLNILRERRSKAQSSGIVALGADEETANAARLASVSFDRYDMFRKRHPVLPPPTLDASVRGALCVTFLVVDGDNALRNLEASAQSVREQAGMTAQGVVLVNKERAELAKSSAAFGYDAKFQMLEIDPGGGGVISGLQRAAERLSNAEWLIVTREPLQFDPFASQWFEWAAAHTTAVAGYCDEDHSCRAHADGVRNEMRTRPVFRSKSDVEAIVEGVYSGPVLGVRRSALLACFALSDGDSRAAIHEDWWAHICRHIATQGPIVHIPRVLASKLDSRDARIGTYIKPSIHCKARRPLESPVEIIIPTRDRLDLLAPCIDAFHKQADEPSRIRVHVVDTGSQDSDTVRYLDDGEKSGRLRITRLGGPFNWSRANNIAAAEGDAGILLFANNDIEMLAAGWDSLLRERLSDPRIGAVGGLLLYPDDTIQHAGIVLGHNDQTEHEGRSWPRSADGPDNRFKRKRTIGAVTGALLACRRSTFHEAAGFDEAQLPVWYNDIDFCLKLRKLGYRILYEPGITALHHESVTIRATYAPDAGRELHTAATRLMVARWGDAFRIDPYYNPHFGRHGRTFSYIREPSMDEIIAHIETIDDPCRRQVLDACQAGRAQTGI